MAFIKQMRSFENTVNSFSIANKNVLPIEQIILVTRFSTLRPPPTYIYVMVSPNLYATDMYIRFWQRIYTSVAYRLGETITYIYVGAENCKKNI